MSILDIIQIAVTVFAVCVFIFSAHVSRKTRRFEQELENRRSHSYGYSAPDPAVREAMLHAEKYGRECTIPPNK